ncbi:hypothetical protein PtrSN002B_000809 [Pyrenophora tritici-repentis]|uniref:Uncharacterized protein n=2 Tax=Pyrenophora tritici-repentis TaxID=45151 RepID=A0A2W1HTQ3_9PLEO|nr:uncharacterized protein PTRG_05671 [Pyrenophora tritici-repentis Pt-1C-BFP]KAA8618738.1 hypothetical protein PtrV1_08167 [Pyrenophora tritici-repentis]EDU48591.1 predicted protein [Pyrenophora tritici-repentis Pt-1C-BFP]KAF7449210.1 hypothetical protein A1F99_062590 [Pyrenophora tritici-repentis]KAF7570785.1 hypothetical protein PtrM4_107870 [Pyrenophora tritici-repentis]KAI0589067.1 hypothetical protein Alg215_00460 [Pyrenophora tritici-repentis]
MALLSSVWAVYGIGVGNAERDFITSLDTSAAHTPYNASSVVADLPASPNTTPERSNSTSNSGDLSIHHPTDKITYAPSAPVPQPPPASGDLSTPAKAGIITASVVIFLLVFVLLIEYTYLRHKRHERALQRAIEEVERGTELKDSNISESKENMVLESRVEIVVEEGEASERSSVDGGDEWDAGTDGEFDEGDGDLGDWGRGRTWERGRNGMSLPRRDTSE